MLRIETSVLIRSRKDAGARGPKLGTYEGFFSTLLEASTEPPRRALDYRRIEAGPILMFLHPAIRGLPDLLKVELGGLRQDRVRVYWEGIAYVV